MHVQVRLFAGLRERLGISERKLDVPPGTRIGQLWPLLVPDQALPDNVLAARNMEYVDPDNVVEEGDEIAFFPPVTGGGR